MENLKFFFVKDGDVTTVTGLAYREKGHVDDGAVVSQGCFRRERQGKMPFGGSSHGAFIRGGDSDAISGRLFIKEGG